MFLLETKLTESSESRKLKANFFCGSSQGLLSPLLDAMTLPKREGCAVKGQFILFVVLRVFVSLARCKELAKQTRLGCLGMIRLQIPALEG